MLRVGIVVVVSMSYSEKRSKEQTTGERRAYCSALVFADCRLFFRKTRMLLLLRSLWTKLSVCILPNVVASEYARRKRSSSGGVALFELLSDFDPVWSTLRSVTGRSSSTDLCASDAPEYVDCGSSKTRPKRGCLGSSKYPKHLRVAR